jgi:hypothetical protein
MSVKKQKKLSKTAKNSLSLVIDFLEAAKTEQKVRSVKDVRFYFKVFFEATHDVPSLGAGEYSSKCEALRYGLNRLVERGIFSRERPEGENRRFEHWSNHTLSELKKILANNPEP